MMKELSWRNSAVCKGMDVNMFFPDEDNPRDFRPIAKAKAICAECPVIQECLEYAINNDIRVGVYGGMSRKQRRIELKNNRSKYRVVPLEEAV